MASLIADPPYTHGYSCHGFGVIFLILTILNLRRLVEGLATKRQIRSLLQYTKPLICTLPHILITSN